MRKIVEKLNERVELYISILFFIKVLSKNLKNCVAQVNSKAYELNYSYILITVKSLQY